MSKTKTYTCYRCFLITNKKSNIITHFKRKKPCKRSTTCFYSDEEIEKKNNEQLDKVKGTETVINNIINNDNNIINNNDNHIINNFINNNNSVTNITNITLKLDNLTPFNEDWNLSKIINEDKILLMFSQVMYTNFLKKILENDSNKNIIIDENNSCLVYTSCNNNENKYIRMEIENIIKQSMDKLYKQLNDIHSDVHPFLDDNGVAIQCKKNIEDKYNRFNSENKLQKVVSDFITDIYKENKDIALKIMKDTVENESNDIINGF